jgi:hypothetical protein
MKNKILAVATLVFCNSIAFAQGRSGFNLGVDRKSGPGYTQPSISSPTDIVEKSDLGEIRNAEYTIQMNGVLRVTINNGALCDDAFKPDPSTSASFRELKMILADKRVEIPLPLEFQPKLDPSVTYGGYTKPVNTNIRVTTDKYGCAVGLKLSGKGLVPFYTKYFQSKQLNPLGKKFWDLFAALDASIKQN